MRNIVLYLLCSIFLMATFSFGASAASNTFNITELEGKYKTQGRTELVNGTLFMDWSASGIKFSANCSGDVSINVNANATNLQQNSRGGIYFTVIIDDVVQHEDKRIAENVNYNTWTSNSTNYPFHITRSGTSEFTIAQNLSPGVHTFEIYNQTEAVNASFGIQSIKLNGEILSSEGNNNLYIEFVGDSVTAGMGALATSGTGSEALYQDATRTWPYLTAKKLNADWSVIAQTGITASNGIGWPGQNSYSMQTVYPKYRYFSNKTKDYNFSRTADVIVCALGTNDINTYDMSRYNQTLDYVKSQFKEMVKLLRNKNPNAKIVWVYGMMTNEANSTITDAISELGGEREGLYTLQLPTNNAACNGHPSITVQSTYAQKVADFIKDITKPVNNQNPTQSSPSGTTPSTPSNSGNNRPQSNPNNTNNSSPSANGNNTTQNIGNTSDSANSQQQGNQSGANVTGNSSVLNSSDNTQNTQSEAVEVIEDDNTGSKMKLSTIIIIVVMAVCAIAIGVLLFFSSKVKNT